MKTYLRILAYGRPEAHRAALAFLYLLGFNLLGAVSLTLLIPFLEILFAARPEPPPALPFDWFDVASLKAHGYYWLSQQMQVSGKVQVLVGFCLVLLAAIVLKNLFRYLSNVQIAPLEHHLVRRLRDHIFGHLLRLPLGFYTQKPKGHLMNIVSNDVVVVEQAIVGTLMPLLSDPITMVVYLSAMLLISWQMTLFTLVVLPLTGFALSRIARSLKTRARRGQAHLDELTAILDEVVTGMRIVKAYGTRAYEQTRYERANEQFARQMIGFRRRSELASPVTEVLSVLIVLLIILYGGSLIVGGDQRLKASEFIGFIALFSQFLAPIKTFSSALSRIQKALVSFGRIEELLAEPVPPSEAAAGRPVTEFREALRLESVSFSYGSQPVLTDINLEIRRGEMVALVGPSGGGKSTLADLICRFYEVSGGRIVLDGCDIREIDAASLRGLLGVVTQEGILFNDTVRHNIAYGCADRYTPAQIEAAARTANAHEFISELEDGYETRIGERGTRLSGGQRQRIAIARAVLRNPPILILDEATSALDNTSEKIVQEALDRLLRERTSIVIAHRLSTIEHADRIVVLEGGRIVGQGTHAELLATNAAYQRLQAQVR